ncbi:hypothetical protein G7084_01825 [Weissella coleopterorum]|uniref:LiaF transmembrane domain-containing protein n=1 Tax=Weissella coleopterorum TaxID=2714949 RepID=A0A6G8AYK0_9LACO|nr:hypothetical protein [Weissella coleopterorum]QIL50171.1 hypothetical protein G7084_01825 [Weissella coleopterorum]
MKKTNWFWGSFFIIAAAFLIATQIGWLSFQMPLVTVTFAIILIALLVSNLMYRSIGGSIITLTGLAMLFNRQLGIQALMPWTIIGVALLLLIGLKLIFGSRNRWYHYDWHQVQTDQFYHSSPHHSFDQSADRPLHADQASNSTNASAEFEEGTTDSGSTTINITTTMGNNIRYLQEPNVNKINLHNYMGDTKVYFDQLANVDQIELILDNSLGSVNLYLPGNWQITNELNSFLSALDERGIRRQADGPQLVIRGRVYLGNVVIHYI